MIKIEVYRKIEREYEVQRDRNQQELEERKAEIYSKIPSIKKIDSLILKLALEAAKEQIRTPSSESLRKINQDIYDLKKEKNKILIEKNYPEDYLNLRYKCEKCKDTGYLEKGEKCDCLKMKLSKELYEMSNIAYMLEKENFNTFDFKIFSEEIVEEEGISPRENMENILKAVKKFIDVFDEKNDMNLLFYGPTGQGKTFLLNCMAKELIDRNFNVIYQTAFNLIDVAEEKKFRRNEIADMKYKMLFNCDLLIIDDLGIELINSFSTSEVFNIVNTRLLRGKKTLISTNLSPKELSKTYTDRVFSRVFQKFFPLKFFGEDLRLKIN
ncbi:putative DNA replication protein DnaC [Peptoniphilus sp. ING2-D1G]|nr:putative DNA replication protein DnaC [Peptoniphilus sp. ING2-D1G]